MRITACCKHADNPQAPYPGRSVYFYTATRSGMVRIPDGAEAKEWNDGLQILLLHVPHHPTSATHLACAFLME